MTQCLIDCNYTDVIEMKKFDILDSIVAGKGRILVSEITFLEIIYF